MRDKDTKILEEKYSKSVLKETKYLNDLYQVDVDNTSVPGVTIKFIGEGYEPDKRIENNVKKQLISAVKIAKAMYSPLSEVDFKRYTGTVRDWKVKRYNDPNAFVPTDRLYLHLAGVRGYSQSPIYNDRIDMENININDLAKNIAVTAKDIKERMEAMYKDYR